VAGYEQTLHQEPCIKSEDIFEDTPIFGKIPTYSENFKQFSCVKNFVLRYPFFLNHRYLLTSTSAAKN